MSTKCGRALDVDRFDVEKIYPINPNITKAHGVL